MSQNQSPRTCGICRNLVPAETHLSRLRVSVEDMNGLTVQPPDARPGLYHACPKCDQLYSGPIARRVAGKLFLMLVTKVFTDLLNDFMEKHPGVAPDVAALQKQAEEQVSKSHGSAQQLAAGFGPNMLM